MNKPIGQNTRKAPRAMQAKVAHMIGMVTNRVNGSMGEA